MNYDRIALLQIKDSYHQDTKRFLAFLGQRGADMTVTALADYAEYLRAEGYAAQTVNKRLAGAKNRLRRVFMATPAARDTMAVYDFERQVKEIKGSSVTTKEVPPNKLLSVDEVRILVSDVRTGKRTRLLIRFLASTGLRVSELIGIRGRDVAEVPEMFTVRIHGKGRKERRVMVPRPLMEDVRGTFNGATWLFETSHGGRYDRKNVSQAIHAAGLTVLGKRISAHTLRHTFATHAIKNGKSVKAVSVYLGHSTTAITQDMYVHDRLSLEDIEIGI
jgi:integrase/recombinase XerD